MINTILIFIVAIFTFVSCTHFVPLKTSDVFDNKIRSVTKIKLTNQRSLVVDYPDSNKINTQDSILVVQSDSGKVKISNNEVNQYYESRFSFGKTLALTTGIIIIPTLLVLAILYNVDFSQ